MRCVRSREILTFPQPCRRRPPGPVERANWAACWLSYGLIGHGRQLGPPSAAGRGGNPSLTNAASAAAGAARLPACEAGLPANERTLRHQCGQQPGGAVLWTWSWELSERSLSSGRRQRLPRAAERCYPQQHRKLHFEVHFITYNALEV